MKTSWTTSKGSSALKGTAQTRMEVCHKYAQICMNNLMNTMFPLSPPLRVGEPEEIGGVIAFLCSEDASYITGETITVTGGIGCRL